MRTRVIQPNEPSATETAVEADALVERPVGTRTSERPPIGPGRVLAIVLAAVVVLLSVVALGIGSALLWVDSSQTDANGYYTSSAHEFTTDSHAIVANGLDANTGDLDFLLGSDRLAAIRLTTTSTNGDEAVFVGIADQQEIADYLQDVELAEIRDLDFDPFRVTYATLAGNRTPVQPAEAPIWVASSTGSDTRTLEWETEPGDWSVVVMNADGSAGVSAEVAVAAQAPGIHNIGLGLVIGGGIVLLLAAGGLAYAIRTRPRADTSSA
jgi:hypothetical protein